MVAVHIILYIYDFSQSTGISILLYLVKCGSLTPIFMPSPLYSIICFKYFLYVSMSESYAMQCNVIICASTLKHHLENFSLYCSFFISDVPSFLICIWKTSFSLSFRVDVLTTNSLVFWFLLFAWKHLDFTFISEGYFQDICRILNWQFSLFSTSKVPCHFILVFVVSGGKNPVIWIVLFSRFFLWTYTFLGFGQLLESLGLSLPNVEIFWPLFR